MRDYRYVPDDGPPAFISELPTWQIEELLSSSTTLVITDAEGYGSDLIENVKERLRIELIIRSLKES